MTVQHVLDDIVAERHRQDDKWGVQNHPHGTDQSGSYWVASQARADCNEAFRRGEGTWRHILAEEWAEACACPNDLTHHLRDELVQVAAVAVAWIEAIDREHP